MLLTGPRIGGRRQRFGDDGAARPLAHLAVRHQIAVRPEQPRLGEGRRIGQTVEQRAGEVGHQRRMIAGARLHRALTESAGIDAGLFAQRRDIGIHQPVLILVEIEQANDQERQGQGIDEQDAPEQGAKPVAARGPVPARVRPEPRVGGGLGRAAPSGISSPCSGSRCRTASRSGRSSHPRPGTSCAPA